METTLRKTYPSHDSQALLRGFEEPVEDRRPFSAARSIGRATDELDSIAEAATAGLIDTLLLEADRLIPGRIDASSGAIATSDPSNPDDDDVLDCHGEYFLRSGGGVITVPTKRMPT